jgi:hypothetical protein
MIRRRKMKKYVLPILFLLFSVSLFAAEQTWKNVSVIDTMCLSKVKDHPDTHKTDCLLMCADDGFGIIASDGKYLKFDEAGDQKALALFKETDKKDSIRVDVTGELDGDSLKVSSISFTQ